MNRQEVIDEIIKSIERVGKKIQSSDTPTREQLGQVDVLLDTIKFLDNYEENVKVLNEYWRKKHWQQKFDSHRNGGNSK